MNAHHLSALAFCLSAFFSAGRPARADVIYLDNGASLSGIIRDRTDGRVLIELPTGTLTIPESRIARIESEPTAAYHLRSSMEKAEQGERQLALEALGRAEESGASPEALNKAREKISAFAPAHSDDGDTSRTLSLKFYDQALHLLDRTLTLEAADAMESAHHLDPANPEILGKLLGIDYSLYLRGQLPYNLVQQTAQKLLILDPGNEEGLRIIRLANQTESTRQAERSASMETLRRRIERNYAAGAINAGLMDDIRGMLALDPDKSTVLWLHEIQREIKPTLDAQAAQKAAEITAAQADLARRQQQARRESGARAQDERQEVPRAGREDARRPRR